MRALLTGTVCILSTHHLYDVINGAMLNRIDSTEIQLLAQESIDWNKFIYVHEEGFKNPYEKKVLVSIGSNTYQYFFFNTGILNADDLENYTLLSVDFRIKEPTNRLFIC